MKKILVLLLLLSASIAVKADNEWKYTPNNAGGNIFFTLSYCVYVGTNQRIPNNFYVYTTNSNGAKTSDGCYVYKSPFYIIEWNGGGRTSINADSTIPLSMGK